MPAQKSPILDELVVLGPVAEPLAGVERHAVVVGLGPDADREQVEDRVAGDLHQPHLGHFDAVDLIAIVEVALFGDLQRKAFEDPVGNKRPHGRQVLRAPGLLQFEECLLGAAAKTGFVEGRIAGAQPLQGCVAAQVGRLADGTANHARAIRVGPLLLSLDEQINRQRDQWQGDVGVMKAKLQAPINQRANVDSAIAAA